MKSVTLQDVVDVSQATASLTLNHNSRAAGFLPHCGAGAAGDAAAMQWRTGSRRKSAGHGVFNRRG